MIPAQVEKVGRGDLERVPQERLSTEGRLRRGNRGFEQPAVAQPGQTAVRG
jgi:hypothetical protein